MPSLVNISHDYGLAGDYGPVVGVGAGLAVAEAG
jgi:hypothetical protein